MQQTRQVAARGAGEHDWRAEDQCNHEQYIAWGENNPADFAEVEADNRRRRHQWKAENPDVWASAQRDKAAYIQSHPVYATVQEDLRRRKHAILASVAPKWC